jgi:hypothetical protein
MSKLKLLSRDALTDAEWDDVCNTPYLVAIAISQARGSLVDALLERAAGAKAIGDGINNDHPLIREIASRSEMEQAVRRMQKRFESADGRSKAAPSELKELAVQASGRVFEILRTKGGELDLYAYRTFIDRVSRAVAEAAREGDLLGIGGTVVSDAERGVIDAVSDALHPRLSA